MTADSHKTIVEAANRFVIVAVDRLKCGQPHKVLTEKGDHVESEVWPKKFARFPTEGAAKEWMAEHPETLNYLKYTYVVTDL